MKIQIDKHSGIPLYKQIVTSVKEGFRNGSIRNGEILPSLNELAAQCGISMETAKKAYFILKKERIIKGRQGKGYSVEVRSDDSPVRILMLLDKLSAYKLSIHNGLTKTLTLPHDITIQFHNQDIQLFEKMIAEAAGNFDYYIVAPHFDIRTTETRIAGILKKIPNDRLILIDRDIRELKGGIGRIYQDFSNDAANALSAALPRIRAYSRLLIVDSGKSLYADRIIPSVCKMLTQAGIRWSISKGFNPESMKPGTLFFVLGGQLDTDHFAILREAAGRGFTLGRTIGLITYNDEPVNEFICNGITCLSSDFHAMGCSAAEMINCGLMKDLHNPFSLVLRKSV